MAKVLTEKVLRYTAVFEPDKKKGYTASIPSLPGCISEGDTFEEALKNIEEAAGLYLEVMKEKGRDFFREEKVIVAPVEVKI